ncbi:crotonase/enoyl-CoA hydratase family protein [Novosphingobium sp. KACC 22771]|uniref:crotonase/enoyl-CoA hydratase family protein n=1 Tax=Novosphingobium sp. KACC 22771 TaxID=3025670 RepID=UPI0023665A2E|nr:crotonase/enoyl-CoA hydratase family protein [Novosphingobium sp. KACC 22771]WDF74355.1 crotonase/enoyl-CoA hydratase family protein [Novosphingobium sp. KACC 22771]
MEPFLKIEREGAVVIATLNRPEARNAITEREHSLEIVDFCAAMKEDTSVKAIVLTGAGKAFCAGGNVKHMRERSGMFAGSPYALRNTYRTSVQLIGPALYELEVPIIAAINGAAIGLGLDITCMCDIRIMADTAVVAESYVKLGIIPGGGGAWLLPRVIGMARASQLTLTGEAINAATALQYGLVSEVLSPADLLPRARAIAAGIAANPGHATRMAKRLLREGQSTSLPSLLEMAAAYQALAHYTDDHIEAVSAFLDKRDPEFKDA